MDYTIPYWKMSSEWIFVYHYDYFLTLEMNQDHIPSMCARLYDRESYFIEETLRQIRYKREWMQSIMDSGYFLKDQWSLPVS
jgi:hypothetical protein